MSHYQLLNGWAIGVYIELEMGRTSGKSIDSISPLRLSPHDSLIFSLDFPLVFPISNSLCNPYCLSVNI